MIGKQFIMIVDLHKVFKKTWKKKVKKSVFWSANLGNEIAK